MKKPRVVIVGCGNRGLDAYGSWIADHSEEVEVVGLVDPQPNRIALARRIFPQVKNSAVFKDWQDFLAHPAMADGVILATQDQQHREAAVACAHRGYHLLLEKPMAPTEEECREIVAEVLRTGIIFAVAHVLRYAPHFLEIHRLIREGAVGEVVTIQHAEDVAYWHMAHAFVRGNWRNQVGSSFMLLSKSCHDIDLLRYFTGRPCQRVQSFGSLLHFRREMKPKEAGKALFCHECTFEPNCPYSSNKIYLRDRAAKGYRGWPLNVLRDDPNEESISEVLREGPYGRCVYECDNDVVDHQVVNLEYEGGVTASFTMSAFNEGGRRTVVQGTHGIIRAVEGQIRVLDFLHDSWKEVTVELPQGTADRHGGGDGGLLEAWLSDLRTGKRELIRSGAEESLETHLTTFAAERSRRHGGVETVVY